MLGQAEDVGAGRAGQRVLDRAERQRALHRAQRQRVGDGVGAGDGSGELVGTRQGLGDGARLGESADGAGAGVGAAGVRALAGDGLAELAGQGRGDLRGDGGELAGGGGGLVDRGGQRARLLVRLGELVGDDVAGRVGGGRYARGDGGRAGGARGLAELVRGVLQGGTGVGVGQLAQRRREVALGQQGVPAQGGRGAGRDQRGRSGGHDERGLGDPAREGVRHGAPRRGSGSVPSARGRPGVDDRADDVVTA